MRTTLAFSTILDLACAESVTASTLIRYLLARKIQPAAGPVGSTTVPRDITVNEFLSSYLVPGPAGVSTWNPLFAAALQLSVLLRSAAVASGQLSRNGWAYSEEQLFQLLKAVTHLLEPVRGLSMADADNSSIPHS